MSDNEQEKTSAENQNEILQEEIERAKQDIPFSERVQKMQSPDPWPDPPPSEQEGGDTGEDN
jgi:hypothetical protein